MKVTKTPMLLAIFVAAFSLAACNESALEEGAEDVSSAIESGADAVDDAVSDTGNKLEDGCEKLKSKLEMEDSDC